MSADYLKRPLNFCGMTRNFKKEISKHTGVYKDENSKKNNKLISVEYSDINLQQLRSLNNMNYSIFKKIIMRKT